KKTYVDGGVLEGNFVNGFLDSGTSTNFKRMDGGTYTGLLVDGHFHKGKVTFADGEVHEGVFVDGRLKEGKGILPDPEGLGLEVHEGVFVNGCLNGRGKVTAATFTEEGNFVGGELNGPGTLTYADGGELKGTFVDGYIHAGTAENVKCLTSNDIYTGKIVDGQPTGSRTTW
ncbi:hypothetical protein THAOC_15206, partial [Thalassiosira oceanica]